MVTVSNFEFSPSELTIEVGDIVRWNNTGGTHNVDGSEASFPDNPVPFGNELSNELWTYEFIFSTEGTYDYQCLLHAGAMQATITVTGGPTTTDDVDTGILKAYPVPAEDYIIIGGLADFTGNSQVEIFDITGKSALEATVSANAQIDISSLRAGIYIFNLTTQNGQLFTGKILVK